jgi:hypothetical protein
MDKRKKQFCPKGHDTHVTGRLNGSCRTCRKEYERIYNITHKAQQKASVSRWAAANKDHIKDQEYRRTYGITLNDYKEMVTQQEGRCRICKEQKALVVDHCHKTGIVRGLLCSTCNRAMGLFQDDSAKIRSALIYLEQAV